MQSAYLCVIFHVKHKKSSFLILGTMVAKMTTIVGDVAGLQQSQRPSTKGKIAFRNTATYHGGSMNVRVRLRVNSLERQTFVSEKRQQSQMFCCPIVTCKYGILGQKAPQQGYENWNQTHFLLDKNVEKSIGSVLVKYDKSITYHHISLNTFLCTFLASRTDYYFY